MDTQRRREMVAFGERADEERGSDLTGRVRGSVFAG